MVHWSSGKVGYNLVKPNSKPEQTERQFEGSIMCDDGWYEIVFPTLIAEVLNGTHSWLCLKQSNPSGFEIVSLGTPIFGTSSVSTLLDSISDSPRFFYVNKKALAGTSVESKSAALEDRLIVLWNFGFKTQIGPVLENFKFPEDNSRNAFFGKPMDDLISICYQYIFDVTESYNCTKLIPKILITNSKTELGKYLQ